MATILIADDQPMNRQYLVSLLGYFGHRLVEAADGAEALRLARSEHPDLVISDLLMPNMDGQELAKRLHSEAGLARIPILFYSAAYSLRQARAVAQEVGAVDVLPKPGDPQTVVAVVDAALKAASGSGNKRKVRASQGAIEPLSQELSQSLGELEAVMHRLATPLEMCLALAAERDPDRLLVGLAGIAQELAGAKHAWIGLVGEDGLSMRVLRASGAGKSAEGSVGGQDAGGMAWTCPAPVPGSLLGNAIRDGQPVRLGTADTAPVCLRLPDRSLPDSALFVPFASGAASRGGIFLANRFGGEAFSQADTRVISLLAAQGISAYEKVQERLRGEQALRKSTAMFEGLFEAAPDAMLAIDEAGVIRSANAQTEAMFGYAREELIGHPVEYLLPERFHGRHATLRQSYAADPRLRPMGAGLELFGKRKNGTEFPVDVMLSPLETSTCRQVLSVVRDISMRKTNERKILELNGQLQGRVEELQAANQSLEAFSYSVSHDLRAPLRAIDGFARILSEDYAETLDGEAHRLLDVIATNCHKMGKLIDDLLTFSRVSRSEILRSEMDMTALARSVVDEMQAVDPGRQVEAVVRELPPAYGDRALIRQVFVNLISNAWKFTRNSPRPVIEIESCDSEKVPVYVVKDNGVGFDEKYADRLFRVFQRLHSEADFEGTGIGLALVQRIIRRHGGEAWARGKAGEGASFYFTLEGADREGEA